MTGFDISNTFDIKNMLTNEHSRQNKQYKACYTICKQNRQHSQTDDNTVAFCQQDEHRGYVSLRLWPFGVLLPEPCDSRGPCGASALRQHKFLHCSSLAINS